MPEAPITNSTLEGLGPWLHDFELPPPLRIPIDAALRERIRQRHDLVIPPVLDQFLRRDLTGRTALDLGANSGFWARSLARHGAKVTCVEPRPENIAQARTIARLLGDAGLEWSRESAERFLSRVSRRFDVVLCLGLLYHAASAIDLLELAARSCADLLVIDSHCINDDVPYLELRKELHSHPSQGVATVVTVPSRGAVYWMIRSAGFAHVMELANIGNLPEDYRDFTRCAFLARRQASLQPPAGPDAELFLRDDALERMYPALTPASVLKRTESRPRSPAFYQQLKQGADR